jgi:hypothetical protein
VAGQIKRQSNQKPTIGTKSKGTITMKTIGRQEQIDSIVERDTIAAANLRALNQNARNAGTVRVATPGGTIGIDPVIYANVRDSIIRLALRRYYKPGNRG